MKKVFVISKVENGKIKFLFRVHSAIYWNEHINDAAQFENEKAAENFLFEEVRELKKCFFQITWYYLKK
jgi:hypothetical protein